MVVTVVQVENRGMYDEEEEIHNAEVLKLERKCFARTYQMLSLFSLKNMS